MHAGTSGAAVLGGTMDGPVDTGIERVGDVPDLRGDDISRRDDVARGDEPCTEDAAFAVLRLVGDHPGQMGRLRAARLVGGYAVPHRDREEAERLRGYAIEIDWPLREITRLVDALISGKLIAQTPGPRPVLVLTRSGHRALEALVGARQAGLVTA